MPLMEIGNASSLCMLRPYAAALSALGESETRPPHPDG